MDRRSFLVMGTAGLVAGSCALQGLALATRAPGRVAIVDSSLCEGRGLSKYLATLGVPVHEAGQDIGMLWYSTLLPSLTAPTFELMGFIRPSDYFVLIRLAAHGASTRYLVQPVEAGPLLPLEPLHRFRHTSVRDRGQDRHPGQRAGVVFVLALCTSAA